MNSRRPNLFVIGAMKAGSTYLSRLLHAHPSIFICTPEEPSYFVDPRQLRQLWPEMWRRGYWQSEERYLQLFANAGDAALIGEASTAYTKLPVATGVPQRIQRFNPRARFIFIMRDPVERAISHYWHMVGYHADTRQMLDAVRNDPTFVAYSHYAMQLRAYLDVVDRDRLFTVTFENLVRDPLPELRRLYSWLGVDPDFVPADLGRPINVTPAVVYQAKGFGWLQRLRQSALAAELGPRFPQFVRSLLARLATEQVSRQSVPVSETLQFLRPILQERTHELSDMLQRTFPEWTTLWGPNSPQ